MKLNKIQIRNFNTCNSSYLYCDCNLQESQLIISPSWVKYKIDVGVFLEISLIRSDYEIYFFSKNYWINILVNHNNNLVNKMT